MYSHSYRLISAKFVMMIETTMLYIFISVWMTFTFIQGHSCMRNKPADRLASTADFPNLRVGI